MKRAIIYSLGLVFALLSFEAIAQDQLKIGHVDMLEIMSSLPERDSAQVLLDKDTDELELMFEKMQVEYNNLLNNYQENLESFSQLIRQTKEAELIEMQNKIQAFQQNASQQLQQRNYELMQPIYEKVQAAIDTIATQEGFTYILDISKGAVVFTSNNSKNINSSVLMELGAIQ